MLSLRSAAPLASDCVPPIVVTGAADEGPELAYAAMPRLPQRIRLVRILQPGRDPQKYCETVAELEMRNHRLARKASI